MLCVPLCLCRVGNGEKKKKEKRKQTTSVYFNNQDLLVYDEDTNQTTTKTTAQLSGCHHRVPLSFNAHDDLDICGSNECTITKFKEDNSDDQDKELAPPDLRRICSKACKEPLSHIPPPNSCPEGRPESISSCQRWLSSSASR